MAPTTEDPAPKYGSSMGTESGDVADVAALGGGPTEGAVWQVPVGISICGRFVDVPTGEERNGVTAGPASTTVTGSGSADPPTLGDFAESAGIALTAGSMTMPGGIEPQELDNTDPPTRLAGAEFSTGDTCGESRGEVQAWVYSTEARASGKGILIVTHDLAEVPFAEEGMAIVLAFSPESSLPTLPPSALGT